MTAAGGGFDAWRRGSAAGAAFCGERGVEPSCGCATEVLVVDANGTGCGVGSTVELAAAAGEGRVGVSVSIDMLSSSTGVSALTGVAGAPNGPLPLLLATALLGELLLPGDSFLPAAEPRDGVALVGLAALLPVCGVEASNPAGRRALRSRNTLPVPNAAAAGLLTVLVPSLALPDAETPRVVAPRGTTCCLPHACSNAANALEVSESHGASSACRRFGVVLVLVEPPAAAAAA